MSSLFPHRPGAGEKATQPGQGGIACKTSVVLIEQGVVERFHAHAIDHRWVGRVCRSDPAADDHPDLVALGGEQGQEIPVKGDDAAAGVGDVFGEYVKQFHRADVRLFNGCG